MSALLTQLTTLCADHPTRSKWLFVPSYALGLTIAERLARIGNAWANLRVTIPLDVALPMSAPSLVARGIDPAAESLGLALVMRLLLDLPAAVPAYFRPLADQPRMADSVKDRVTRAPLVV